MDAAFRYLKWNDDVVGLVAPDLSVRFAEPRFNTTVGLYTHGQTSWTPDQFLQFLSERIMSPARRDIERLLFRCGLYTHGQTSWTPDQFLQFLSERIMSPARRDIERLLFRCGLSEYDVFKIADATRAINPRDELWLAPTPDASMAEAATEVFDAIFLQRTDAAGDSVDTPEGANVKRYGASQGVYGIVKQRISPLSTDVESEVAAFLLAEMLGMPCCRAWRFGDDAVFYPLYDNGRSLFYEDTESFARKAAADPRAFATTFGYVGTYWDHARDIAAKGVRFGDLLNLDVDERTVRQLLVEAGFTDYRLEAATEWIMNAVECLKSLG